MKMHSQSLSWLFLYPHSFLCPIGIPRIVQNINSAVIYLIVLFHNEYNNLKNDFDVISELLKALTIIFENVSNGSETVGIEDIAFDKFVFCRFLSLKK